MVYRSHHHTIVLLIMMGRTAFRCACSAFASHIPLPSFHQRIAVQPGWIVSRGGSSSLTSSLSTHQANEVAALEAIDILGSSLVQREFGGIPYWDTFSLEEFRVCFILGGPGAGKGTQSEFMKKHYPCVHLSAGELLRNVPQDSPHKALVDDCLVAGKIVPVEISLSLLRAAMELEAATNGKSLFFLVDGFPRNFDNLEGWSRCMKGVASVWGVLMYTCPLQELEKRIMSRAETSGRSDDNLKSSQKRFETFERETVPVVDTLRMVHSKQKAAGLPALQVVDIKGDQSMEAVWKDTQQVMNSFVANDVLTANARLLKAAAEGNAELYAKLYSIPEGKIPAEVLKAQESNYLVQVSNTKIEFVTGTKVVVSYDRADGLRETRVWSYQGAQGWTNIHFSRIPLLQ